MTQDLDKTEEQQRRELRELRQQVAELEATAALYRQTQATLRQKTAFVELLKVVAATASEGSTIESVMQVCLEQICKHIGWPVGHVYRVGEERTQELASAHLWYLAHPERFAVFRQVTEDCRFVEGEGLPGRILAVGKPIWIADLSKDTQFPRAKQAKEAGIKAGFGVPVLVGGEVTAVLEFFSYEAAEFDDQLLGVMAHIGTQLGRLGERKRAEATRRDSEEKYRAILANIEDGYCEVDLKGNFTFFNDAMCSIFGYPPKELMGMNYRQYTEPESVPRLFQTFNDIYRTGKSSGGCGYRIFRKDGTPRFVETSATLIRDANGQGVGFLGILRDITERKQAEEVLRQSEERYRTIIEDMTDAYWEMDLTGRLTFFNNQMTKLSQRSKEELMGLNNRQYMDEETTNKVGKIFKQIYLTGEPARGVSSDLIRADGTRYSVESNISLVRDVEGKPIGFRGINRDITERKQAEEVLRQSEERYRTIIEDMTDAYWEMDLTGRLTYFNDQLMELHGRSREALTGLSYKSYMGEETVNMVFKYYNQLFCTGEPIKGLIHEQYQGDGTLTYVESNVSLIRDVEGRPVGFRGISRDITERKRTEAALQESKDYLDRIINTIADPIFVIDRQHRFVLLNDTFCQFVGQTREAMLGKTVTVYCPPDEAQAIIEKDDLVFADGSGKSTEDYFTDVEGYHHIIITKKTIYEAQDGERFLVGVIRDITELKQAEEALKLSEERYRTIIEDMTEAYWEMDLGGTFTFCNNQLVREHRRSREELLGLNNKQYMDEDTVKRVGKIFKQIYLSREPAREVAYEMTKGDGTRYFVESNVSLIINEEGNPIGFRGVNRDVTERKQAELELQRAKETAEAANRAKSEFLANMSHEIRTPMNGIIGMTELALDTDLAPEQRDYLTMVKDSADALLGVINDILDFSKIEAGKLNLDPIPFFLRNSVNDTMKGLTLRAHQQGLELACQVLPDVPDALIGDSGRLRQILLNLIGNAIKFTEMGEITLRVEVEAHNFEESLLHFTVADTGIGIPLDKQQMIFEAFSQSDGSTTRRYGGTGLGLTISSKLVEMMGGRLWVESQPGLGSTFHFTARFSAQKEASASAQMRALDAAVKTKEPIHKAVYQQSNKNRGPYHILLAEDNPVNQRLAMRLLEKRGHRVVVVDNGLKAVAAFEQGSFDLILMDMQMPEMNGYEATAVIREKENATDRHIPIIALTAHTMKGDRERCLEAGMDGYVAKPIKLEELFEAIEEVAAMGISRAEPSPNDFPVEEVMKRQAVLLRLDGDEELLRELAEMFLQEYPPLLAKIQEAITQSNSQGLEQAAHKLKGSISNFEAKSAYEAALNLEIMGRLNHLGDAAKASFTLTTEIERLQQALFTLR